MIKPVKTLFIENAFLLDPACDREERLSMLVVDGKIKDIGTEVKAPKIATRIDGSQLIMAPGFFDLRADFREPGYEEKETILSGCNAAAAGGFTDVCLLPDTDPPMDCQDVVRFVLHKQASHLVDCHPIGAISRGLAGETLADMGELIESGVVAFSDGMRTLGRTDLVRRALEYSLMYDVPVIDHCQEPGLSENGVMNESTVSTKLGLPGVPNVAEAAIIQRNLLLAEFTGARIHIPHVSTREGVEMIRIAKEKGIRVTSDVTPHHLILTDADIEGFRTEFKVNPPLRTAIDAEACLQGLLDGVIDCIASDHAPHDADAKELDFSHAPFGCSSIELVFSVCHQYLVKSGRMRLDQLINRLAVKPRKVFGKAEIKFEKGESARFVLLDLEAETTVGKLVSKSSSTPFSGHQLRGRVAHTFANGQLYSI